MELLATCSSSSSSLSSSIFGTQFRYIFSSSKKRSNWVTHTQFNGRANLKFGVTKAMASAAWNGYAGSASFRGNNNTRSGNSRIFTQVASCLVIPPPTGTKPRAIIKFLGGAFLGAVPELTYRYPFVYICSKL